MGRRKARMSVSATFKPQAFCVTVLDDGVECPWQSRDLDNSLGLARQRAKEHVIATGHHVAVDTIKRTVYVADE